MREHLDRAPVPSRPARGLGPWLLVLLIIGCLVPAWARAAAPPVVRCELEGVVDAGSGAYLADCVKRAEEAGAQALLVRLDTPGGSLDATRAITRAFLDARVPVLVWVGPSGAHAGGAGVLIALASSVSAMAPGASLGAARPGDDDDARLAREQEADTVAFAEGLARQRGRDAGWAASAVRDGAGLPADRAVASRGVEFVAPTEADLLASVDGQRVEVAGGHTVTLSTREARVVSLEPGLSQRVVHALAQPSLVYILFLVAALGLVVELSHPGAVAPGLLGMGALVLALMASATLPVRSGAVVLMLLGVGLILAELFVTSGLLGAAGVGLLLLGGVFLVDRLQPDWFVEPSFRLSWAVMLPTALVLAGSAAFVAYRAAQTRRLPQRGGDAGLVGEAGTALAPITPSGGEVFVHGERWRAISFTPIREGAHVVVRAVEGLTLTVAEAMP